MQLREELDLAHSNAKGLDEMTLLKFTRLANVCRHATNATGKFTFFDQPWLTPRVTSQRQRTTSRENEEVVG